MVETPPDERRNSLCNPHRSAEALRHPKATRVKEDAVGPVGPSGAAEAAPFQGGTAEIICRNLLSCGRLDGQAGIEVVH